MILYLILYHIYIISVVNRSYYYISDIRTGRRQSAGSDIRNPAVGRSGSARPLGVRRRPEFFYLSLSKMLATCFYLRKVGLNLGRIHSVNYVLIQSILC